MLCNLRIIESSSIFVDETKLLQGWFHSNSLHPPSCLCLLMHQEQIDILLLMLKPKWESKKWNDSCTNSQWWCWNVVKSSWCCRIESIKFSSQQFRFLIMFWSLKSGNYHVFRQRLQQVGRLLESRSPLPWNRWYFNLFTTLLEHLSLPRIPWSFQRKVIFYVDVHCSVSRCFNH